MHMIDLIFLKKIVLLIRLSKDIGYRIILIPKMVVEFVNFTKFEKQQYEKM